MSQIANKCQSNQVIKKSMQGLERGAHNLLESDTRYYQFRTDQIQGSYSCKDYDHNKVFVNSNFYRLLFRSVLSDI